MAVTVTGGDAPTLREFVMAILEEHRYALGLADSEREKTAAALRGDLSRTVSDLDRRLTDHIAAQVAAVSAALVAASTLEQQRFDAAMLQGGERLEAVRRELVLSSLAQATAVEKADLATEKRFESVNEFRAQLNDQARTFVAREILDARFDELTKTGQRNAEAITEIRARTSGFNAATAVMVTLATLVVSIVVAVSHYVG